LSLPVPSAAWVASLRLQQVKKFNFRIIGIVGDVVTKLGSVFYFNCIVAVNYVHNL
jgi:hypothetical protein